MRSAARRASVTQRKGRASTVINYITNQYVTGGTDAEAMASESRIAAAVLGACGLRGNSVIRGRFAERHRVDAPNVTCPVLFMVQWDDEIFDRDGASPPTGYNARSNALM